MIKYHDWSLTEIENMYPFVLDFYFEMLSNWIKEENERIEERNRQRG